MKRKDKVMIHIFRILGVIILLLSVSTLLIKETYIVNYTEYGIMEKDLTNIAITLFIASLLFIAISYGLKKKIKNDIPVIKMSEDGLIENGTMEIGLIAWNNIEKIGIYEIMNGYNSRKYLGIWVKDLGALCENISEMKAELIKANVASGAPPVVIPQTLIRTKLETVIEEIERYRKEISYRIY